MSRANYSTSKPIRIFNNIIPLIFISILCSFGVNQAHSKCPSCGTLCDMQKRDIKSDGSLSNTSSMERIKQVQGLSEDTMDRISDLFDSKKINTEQAAEYLMLASRIYLVNGTPYATDTVDDIRTKIVKNKHLFEVSAMKLRKNGCLINSEIKNLKYFGL